MWLWPIIYAANFADAVAQRVKKLQRLADLDAPTDGTVQHYRDLVERLERDLIESARAEGNALDQLRKSQEQITQLKGWLTRTFERAAKAREDARLRISVLEGLLVRVERGIRQRTQPNTPPRRIVRLMRKEQPFVQWDACGAPVRGFSDGKWAAMKCKLEPGHDPPCSPNN